jgi:hypothetical protein
LGTKILCCNLASFKASSFNQYLESTCPIPPHKIHVSLELFFLVLEEDSLDFEDGGKYILFSIEAWRQIHQLEKNVFSIYIKSYSYLWRYNPEELDF